MLALRRNPGGRQEGFTLIELMVVVLIIAILIAIAIPTFLGARERAQDRAAQSTLRNALTAENVYYTDGQWFTQNTGTPGGMQAIEQSIQWSNAGSSSQNEVHVEVCGNINPSNSDEGTAVTLSNVSAHGHGFAVNDVKVDTGGFTGTSYDVDPGAGAALPWSYGCSDTQLPGGLDSAQAWRH